MIYRLLVLLAFLPLSASAQLASFPTPGLEYGSVYYCNQVDCMNNEYNSTSMRYTGDTIICGVNWNRFMSLPLLNYPIYLRTDQGKYYRRVNCTIDRLMYDFSKGIGDTIVTADLGPLKVVDVGVFTLDNGSTRKKMTVQTLSPSLYTTFTWVDGIGDIERSFFRSFDFEGGHEQLVCMRDSSGVFYHNLASNLDCETILCPQPRPHFDFSCVNGLFQFTNLSLEANSYTWEFGDGQSSTEENPVHTFPDPGCYDVTLKAKSYCLPTAFELRRRVSVDAPMYWKPALHQPPAKFLKIQFLDDQKGWALSDSALWKTVDGGVQWNLVPYPGIIRPVADLQFKDFEHGIVSIRIPNSMYYNQILWTNDGGASWTLHSLVDSPTISAIERVSDNVALVAVHYQGIYVTKNGGQSWTNIFLNNNSLVEDFISVGGDTIYFAGVNQFPSPVNTSNIFTFGKSFDGLNWQVEAFPGIEVGEKMSFVNPQKGWMMTSTAIYHTADAGQNWAIQDSVTSQNLELFFDLEFADSLHGWVNGYHTGIYGTSDGGQHWVQQACPRTEESIWALATVSAEKAFVMTEDGLFAFSASPDTVNICTISSLTEPAMNPVFSFSIKPNPASDNLEIVWPGAQQSGLELVLFNAQGIPVLRWPATRIEPVSVAHLQVGFYFIQAVSDGKTMPGGKKLIISR